MAIGDDEFQGPAMNLPFVNVHAKHCKRNTVVLSIFFRRLS